MGTAFYMQKLTVNSTRRPAKRSHSMSKIPLNSRLYFNRSIDLFVLLWTVPRPSCHCSSMPRTIWCNRRGFELRDCCRHCNSWKERGTHSISVFFFHVGNDNGPRIGWVAVNPALPSNALLYTNIRWGLITLVFMGRSHFRLRCSSAIYY